MAEQLLYLNPDFPVCWESMSTLRIGVDQAEFRLHDPSASEQRFIARLREGIPADELEATAQACGLPRGRRQELLTALSPLLQKEPPHTAHKEENTQLAPPRIVIAGHSPFIRYLRAQLNHLGFRTTPVRNAAKQTPALTVLVERYASSALRAERVMLRNVPHLTIVLSDRSILVGPLILPDAQPCLACVEAHDRELDQLRPLLAAQLMCEAPAAESLPCAELMAAVCCETIRQHAIGECELAGTRMRYPLHHDVPGLVPAVETIAVAEGCCCAELAAAA